MRKYVAVWVIIALGCVGTAIFALRGGSVLAQNDIAVHIISNDTTHVSERYYEYTEDQKNISIEIPCTEIRGKERETVIIYGLLIYPNSDGEGILDLKLIPSRGETWGGVIYSFYCGSASTPILLPYNIPIFPGSKLRLEWTNPGSIEWKLILYVRTLV
jgi:hypothetical protein